MAHPASLQAAVFDRPTRKVMKDNKIARASHFPDKHRYTLCTEAKKSAIDYYRFRSMLLTLLHFL